MSFLFSDAYAAAGEMVGLAGGQRSESSLSLLMIVGIFALFYFMMIRPQNKRAKEHRELVSKLQKGDEIVTAGGLLAKVSGVDEQFIKAIIADGIEICLQRGSVTTVLPKGTIKSL